jgi:hypothetical protein
MQFFICLYIFFSDFPAKEEKIPFLIAELSWSELGDLAIVVHHTGSCSNTNLLPEWWGGGGGLAWLGCAELWQ